jgi:hypothetical protein
MWLVVGGPLIVVIASFVTLYLAIRSPDTVYRDPPVSRSDTSPSALEHAMQARNHAATGGMAPKAPAAAASRP